MNISIIGAGYVGLTSAAVFAKLGHRVISIDNDEQKIDKLSRGIVPIYEPGLSEIITEFGQNIEFTTDMRNISDNEAVLIAVCTPSANDGKADLSYVYQALDNLIEYLGEQLIIIKSTVPPQTCRILQEYIIQKYKKYNNIVSIPEFLREGYAITDFLEADRIVIGLNESASYHASKKIIDRLYANWYERNINVFYTDTTTAELIKYATNSFLAAKICFINEMSQICEEVGANIDSLSAGVGLDSRIGDKFLKTGPGFGGSCFPKDILALTNLASLSSGSRHLPLISSIMQSNSWRITSMVEKIKSAMHDQSIEGKIICAAGITFKANTDDVRDSPAIEIIKLLYAGNVKEVRIYDPKGNDNAKNVIPEAVFCSNLKEASIAADIIVIFTEWPEFISYDYSLIKQNLINPIIVDLRNILPRQKIENIGYKLVSLGSK